MVASPLSFELRGVAKQYGGGHGLARTDLAVERGRTTVLIGPSGSGKSTLLRLLLGLLRPDEGEVRFDGEPVVPASRLRMGYVIQDGGLFPHLTAAGDVPLVARWLGREAARVAGRLPEAAGGARRPRRRRWSAAPSSSGAASASASGSCARSCSPPRCCSSTSRSARSIR